MSQKLKGLTIGIDIVTISRFKTFTPKHPFILRTFTKHEITDCIGKTNFTHSIAVKFAAKEAVKKCIEENLKFRTIEVLSKKNSAPFVEILDSEINERYNFSVSLSHEEDFAVAVCICQRVLRKK